MSNWVGRRANAEELPFADGDFDLVLFCLGVMFAPHHRRAADELVRVCRPGGTIGRLNWTAEGFHPPMFITTKPYPPTPRRVWSHDGCGQRGSRARVTWRAGERSRDGAAYVDRGCVSNRASFPRFLSRLRTHDHCLPRHRCIARSRRRTRFGTGGTGRTVPAGRIAGNEVGVSADHGPQALVI